MTITKRELQTAVLVNGKEIGSNIDKEVKLEIALYLTIDISFLLKDVESSTTKTRSTKTKEESEKKRLNPHRKAKSIFVNYKTWSSPSHQALPPSKKSSQCKAFQSFQNNGVNIYRKMLQESVGSRAITRF